VNTKLAALVRKRRELVAHAATQRAMLAALAEDLRRPLAVADGAYRIAQAVRRHPAISALTSITMLAQLKRHRLLLWSGRLLGLWEVYRVLREQWPRREADAPGRED
jgi:signal transduction histidine kinase